MNGRKMQVQKSIDFLCSTCLEVLNIGCVQKVVIFLRDLRIDKNDVFRKLMRWHFKLLYEHSTRSESKKSFYCNRYIEFDFNTAALYNWAIDIKKLLDFVILIT